MRHLQPARASVWGGQGQRSWAMATWEGVLALGFR